jgi:hypothetical protein
LAGIEGEKQSDFFVDVIDALFEVFGGGEGFEEGFVCDEFVLHELVFFVFSYDDVDLLFGFIVLFFSEVGFDVFDELNELF